MTDALKIYKIDRVPGTNFLFVMNRSIILSDTCKVIEDKKDFWVIQEDFFDGVPRLLKGYKTKEIAEVALKAINQEQWNWPFGRPKFEQTALIFFVD